MLLSRENPEEVSRREGGGGFLVVRSVGEKSVSSRVFLSVASGEGH